MYHFDTLSPDGKADILRSGRIIFKGEYPKNEQNRSFKPAWFERFSWLEHNDDSKGAQCFYCKYLAPQASKNDEFKSGLVVSSLEINQQQAVGIKENNLIYEELVNK